MGKFLFKTILILLVNLSLLLKFLLKFIPSGDRVGSSLDIVTPTTPPNKSYIFKRKGRTTYLLSFVRDVCCSKVSLEPPKEVIDLPCVPHPTIGCGLERATRWGGGCLSIHHYSIWPSWPCTLGVAFPRLPP